MSEKIENTEVAENAKPEMKRVTVSIPADQYDFLVDDHRFELKLDKPEFFRHVFQTYADGVSR